LTKENRRPGNKQRRSDCCGTFGVPPQSDRVPRPNERGESNAMSDECDNDERLSQFGPVIFAYSREQAIADGVLVDVSEMAREAGFRFPVAVTRAVWEQYVAVPESVPWQDEDGRLWDVLWMFRCAISQHRVSSPCLFELRVANEPGPPRLVTLKAVCGPSDSEGSGDERVITIMLPNED